MDKINHYQENKVVNEEHKRRTDVGSVDKNLSELEKKVGESFSIVMLGMYEDQGLNCMTNDDQKQLFNTRIKMERMSRDSDQVFSSITISSYKDLGRYDLSNDR